MSELENEMRERLFGAPEPPAEPELETADDIIAADEAGEEAPEPEAEQPDERLRDPATGQFVAQQPEEEQRKWGGRFDSPDEMEADYKQRIGSMGNEIGQLRQILEQQQQQAQQVQQRQNAPSIDDDPRAAVEYSLRTGDMDMYNLALAAWAEESPGEAMVFSQRVAQAQINAAVNAALYQRDQYQNTTRSAWDNARSRLEGFDSLTDQMVQAAQRVPNFENTVQNGSQEQKEQMFETVYWMARGMAMAAPQAPQGASPAQHPLAGRAAAFVAPPTNGGAPQGETLSPKEQAQQDLRAAFNRGLEMMSE